VSPHLSRLSGFGLIVVSSICTPAGTIFALAGDLSRAMACLVLVAVCVIAVFAVELLEARRER
jgi:hypothetical protein